MKKPKGEKKAEPAPVAPKAEPTTASAASRVANLSIDGEARAFDIDNADLPGWIKKKALSSGGYPYDEKLDDDAYAETLETLQIELVKMQAWLQSSGNRVLIIFEGRDAAGKGGTIEALREYMNPRQARNVALSKPTETERGQWYFQRYISHFPGAGEFVTFDRSWYNRAGVEPVMGFCTPEQHQRFLKETPHFEQRIVNDGIYFFKFWLDIGQQMQLKRFHDRRHSPLTNWKFSPMDVAGMGKWDAYSDVIASMFDATHTKHAPWMAVRSNDKRRARLETIRHILLALPYEGRDIDAIGKADAKIIDEGPSLTKNSA